MKPEPLKNKRWTRDVTGIDPYFNYYRGRDIKSAVEWYRKYLNSPLQFDKDYPNLKNERTSKTYKIWLLYKAFEDVIK